VIRPATTFDGCGKTSRGVHPCRPDGPRPGRYDFVPADYRGRCYVCVVVMSWAVDARAFRAGLGRHWGGSESCLRIGHGHE